MSTLPSVILRTAVRWISPLLLLFSLFLLLRGHNEPGGGFAGGLIAATGFALITFGFSLHTAQQLLRVHPLTLVATGLTLALASGLTGWLMSAPFLTGAWITVPLPGNLRVELGTPLAFDVGVYLTVLGAALTMLFAFAEE